jgi:NADPH-dependent curcumin reductase CurA
VSERNRKVVLSRPIVGVPAAADFRVVEEPLPEPGPGQFLVRHHFISLDPYQRPAIAGRHGGAPLGAGDMPPAETVGEVIRSRHEGFRAGQHVRHIGGWQEYSLSDGERAFVVDPERAPLSAYLGVLGMPGLTAWASAVKLADVRPGQNVLVSAAAGPVGATFGQIAMQRGARAIGIAGGDEKCRLVTGTFGFAACVNYKRPGFLQDLQRAVGEGADVYHDNVGGQMLVDALSVLKPYGTVVLCGLITQYNTPDSERQFSFNLGLPIMKRAVMKGLVVYDFEPQRARFFDEVAPWVATGKVRYAEDRVSGIERTGEHFARLMRGENVGKALVVLQPD